MGLLPPHGPLLNDDCTDSAQDVVDCTQLLDELRARMPAGKRATGVIGFVGYPNVGKSSVINALFGSKKVSMSRTPGKTKHLQTLELVGQGLMLCDCPGLVFPSVVATKAHLTINGVAPLVELRDPMPSVRLVVEKVGLQRLLDKYALSQADLQNGALRREGVSVDGCEAKTTANDSTGAALKAVARATAPGIAATARDPPGAFLAAFAVTRRHFLRQAVPDESWAARRLLQDYCTGALLHCEEPPAAEADAGTQAGVQISGAGVETDLAVPAHTSAGAADANA